MFLNTTFQTGLNIFHIMLLQCGRIKPYSSSLTNVENSTSIFVSPSRFAVGKKKENNDNCKAFCVTPKRSKNLIFKMIYAETGIQIHYALMMEWNRKSFCRIYFKYLVLIYKLFDIEFINKKILFEPSVPSLHLTTLLKRFTAISRSKCHGWNQSIMLKAWK